MSNKPTLTTTAGAPSADNQKSLTAGPRGPVLLQDYPLIEKLAHQNRERIPERTVHAKGWGAYGTLTITGDISKYTKAKCLQLGAVTNMLARFSTVAGELGAADAERDVRGFALKFYTEDGNWDLVAASPLAFHEFMHIPREITRAAMDRVRDDYARAAINADKAGFDMIELHAGHGYLLSGFISPLSNERKDDYGGSLENRMRFPLEIFDMVKANWPKHKPISVRISATDWHSRGITPEDGLQIAAMFKQHGATIIDVSAGQTSRWASPVYGRMFQTPFSEMVRNEVQIPTIAVGAITTADQVNTIIAAGRADLCALGRPHLTNPHFTLTASAEYGYEPQFWPLPYLSGKDQAFRLTQRQQVEIQALRQAARPSSHDQRRQVPQAAE